MSLRHIDGNQRVFTTLPAIRYTYASVPTGTAVFRGGNQ
jgi:hypothetical protein